MRGEAAALSCASVSKELLTLGNLKRSDGDDISIANMTNVFRVKRKKSLSSPGRSDKLDFHGVGRVQFDDCTQVTQAQTGVRHIMRESDSV